MTFSRCLVKSFAKESSKRFMGKSKNPKMFFKIPYGTTVETI